VDYRDLLDPEEFSRFRSLRELRKKMAEHQGVPVYAVFSNRQLADIAHTCPVTIQDLSAIEGIGKGKAERYGAEFLEAVRGILSQKPKLEASPRVSGSDRQSTGV
jgi:superfamily II DNA helicase RecQ